MTNQSIQHSQRPQNNDLACKETVKKGGNLENPLLFLGNCRAREGKEEDGNGDRSDLRSRIPAQLPGATEMTIIHSTSLKCLGRVVLSWATVAPV